MSHLFQPLRIKDIELKNRIVVSPMCMYSSEDGFANDWHLVHLGSRAVGGAGMVVMEATAVSPEGRISPFDQGIWKDEHLAKLKQITAFIREQGCVAAVQLAHAGRKASTDRESVQIISGPLAWQPVAPSAIAFKDGEMAPLALDLAGVQKVIQDYAAAAKRAFEAGFQVVEIHAAHGYLLNEFLSPYSNHRTDEYGGSFENRIRILREVVASVKTTWPKNLPLLVRISATDWIEDGWKIEDSVRLAKILKEDGVDLVDCSTGGIHPKPKIPVGPLYQTQFAEQIKKEAAVMTAAVGMITTAEEAESVIRDGRADLVFMAREFLRDPYFPLHAAKILGDDVEWPRQYFRAKKK